MSTDPEFAIKAADVIGLYLNPPEKAIVVCVDEKPDIQALSRTVGIVECYNGKMVRGLKSACKRNGTVDLFSALEVFAGKSVGKEKKYRKQVDFLNFMDNVVAEYPSSPTQEIHVILDKCCVHKRCNEWLAAHQNVEFHCASTSESWLDQIETWIGLFSRRTKEGTSSNGTSSNSAEQLTSAIKDYVGSFDERKAQPFIWRKREVGGSPSRDTVVNLQD